MSSAAKLKTASVLAFERKLDVSDGLFAAGQWNNRKDGASWSSMVVREKSVRGTISNRLSASKAKDAAKDAAKLDAAIQNPNLQTVDVCTLPSDADTLRVNFTLRILSGVNIPSACNDPAYREKLVGTISGYVEEVGFGELALRYASNLANGRFLWRNRLGSEMIEVQVNVLENGETKEGWTFDAFKYSLRDFSYVEGDPIHQLANVIQGGLEGKSPYTLLEVVAYARCGSAQEVYPSQELLLDGGERDKSKTLYSVNGVAGMHSQKLGNALRTVDTWYSESDEFGPIPVEPYGSVTSQGRAFRQPKEKADFYSLLDGWVLKDSVPELEQQHFVIANFVRGGVFGGKE